MAGAHAIFSTISFFLKKKMAESDYPIFRSKKRKVEEENELDNSLLDFPLAENSFPESQPSGSNSQAVAAEIFDLTLVEPEPEKNEVLFVWKKLELHSVTDLLHKCDKTMFEVPENFSAKYDKDENYLGTVKCSNDRCKPFICRDSNNKKNLNIKLSQRKFQNILITFNMIILVKQHIRNHHKKQQKEIHPAFRPKKPPTITETNKREILASECSILSKFKLPMSFFMR